MPGRLSQDATSYYDITVAVEDGTAFLLIVPEYVTDGADNLLLTAVCRVVGMTDALVTLTWYEEIGGGDPDLPVQGSQVGSTWTILENDTGAVIPDTIIPVRAVVAPPSAGQAYILVVGGRPDKVTTVAGYAHRFD